MIAMTFLHIPLSAVAENVSHVKFEGYIVSDTCQSFFINEKLNVNCFFRNKNIPTNVGPLSSSDRFTASKLTDKSGLIQSIKYEFLNKAKNIRLVEISYF